MNEQERIILANALIDFARAVRRNHEKELIRDLPPDDQDVENGSFRNETLRELSARYFPK
jgi:hypothetical protein